MDTLKLAQGLLDNEMEEFDHNPSKYVESLGGSKKLQNKISQFSDKISLTKQDYESLQLVIESILESNPKATTIDIAEHNKISDFLCNCIAGKINEVSKL